MKPTDRHRPPPQPAPPTDADRRQEVLRLKARFRLDGGPDEADLLRRRRLARRSAGSRGLLRRLRRWWLGRLRRRRGQPR